MFWHRLPTDWALRSRDRQPGPIPGEAAMARTLLARQFPDTQSGVRPTSGDLVIKWSDGRPTHAVLAALAQQGVAHLHCMRNWSGLAVATALIRQAREVLLDQPSRTQQLLEDLTVFTDQEVDLGRQLLAFAGGDDPYRLAATVQRCGLSVLAETLGVSTPDPVPDCWKSAAPPAFAMRADWAADSKLSCTACLAHHGPGHEIRYI